MHVVLLPRREGIVLLRYGLNKVRKVSKSPAWWWKLHASCSNGKYRMMMWGTMAPCRAAAKDSSSSEVAAAPEEAAAKPAKPRGRRKASAQPAADAPAPSMPDEAHAAGDSIDPSVAGAPTPTARGRSSRQGAGAGIARRKKGGSKGAASSSRAATAEDSSNSLCGPASRDSVHAAASDVLPAAALPVVSSPEAGASACSVQLGLGHPQQTPPCTSGLHTGVWQPCRPAMAPGR